MVAFLQSQVDFLIHNKLLPFLQSQVVSIIGYLPNDAAMSTLNYLFAIYKKSPKTANEQVQREEESKDFKQRSDIVDKPKRAKKARSKSTVPFLPPIKPLSLIETTVTIVMP